MTQERRAVLGYLVVLENTRLTRRKATKESLALRENLGRLVIQGMVALRGKKEKVATLALQESRVQRAIKETEVLLGHQGTCCTGTFSSKGSGDYLALQDPRA